METPKNLQSKNDKDFNEYYQVAFSCNRYIERLLEKIMRAKGMTNKSQALRNCIYEYYQILASKGCFDLMEQNKTSNNGNRVVKNFDETLPF